MYICVVGMGANLGAREQTLDAAVVRLTERLGEFLAVSPQHRTRALVAPGEESDSVPDYLNAAAKFSTSLSPAEILQALLEVERELGRDRSQEEKRWQSRIIDLDLLAVEDLVVSTSDLSLPHPEMHKRDFVLQPFQEIWPDWLHPIRKRTVSEMLQDLVLKPSIE